MSALGRILQAIGWIWVIAGFAGPFGGFDVGGALPGVILIFVARVLRTQAARRSPEDLTLEPDQPTRVLNTDRPPTAKPAPSPPPRSYPLPALPVEAPASSAGDDPLTRFLAGGDEPEPNKETTPSDSTPSVSPAAADDKPKTSAELIAEARRRWDPQS